MGKRRGHGEGSIYQRKDGLWCCQVDLGWIDGKRRRKYLYGKTRREVAEQLKVVLREQQQGLPVPTERQTVAQFLDRWLNDVAKRTLEESTFEQYGRRIRLDLAPHLGRFQLGKLTPQDISECYSALLEEKSPRTAEYDHAILHRALEQAVRWNLIPRNPADMVDAPRPGKRDIHPLAEEEVERLLKMAAGGRLYALYVVALATGMRQGELLGLQWADVNWRDEAIVVRQAARRTRTSGLALTGPKTSGSRRTVTVPRSIMAVLRMHRGRQHEERLAAGSQWTDLDLVFPNRCGKPIEKQNLLYRSFVPLLKRAGLRQIRFHDLRHTHATILLARGANPKVVSERLGHASVRITLDIYAHVIPTMQRDAAERLTDLFAAVG